MLKIISHDGPARKGQWHDITTPAAIDYKKIEMMPNKKTPFKIQEEIAKENVEKTINLAKEDNDTSKIAVIQGANYSNLRIKCAKELEKLGYTTMMFANADQMQQNPEKLLEIIIETRENINPNTTLYFPFATTQIIPILAYLGIDLFDTTRAIYEAKNNNIMTNTNIYPKEEYNICDNIEQENIRQLNFTIKEVQENIQNKTLRNLTEQKATTNPELMSLHRLLDKLYPEYLQKYTQLY